MGQSRVCVCWFSTTDGNVASQQSSGREERHCVYRTTMLSCHFPGGRDLFAVVGAAASVGLQQLGPEGGREGGQCEVALGVSMDCLDKIHCTHYSISSSNFKLTKYNTCSCYIGLQPFELYSSNNKSVLIKSIKGAPPPIRRPCWIYQNVRRFM